MINIIRKNQQFLMILVTVLVIIAFAWLYNAPRENGNEPGTQVVANIYGRNVYGYEVSRIAAKSQIAMALGMYDFLQGLMGSDRSGDEFIWNSLILKHEADKLDIHPNDEAVKKEIQNLQAFQTNGQFDPSKYNEFVKNVLSPRGFTAADLEEIVKENLQLKKLKELVGSTVAISPGELKQVFDTQYAKADLAVIRLKKDAFKPAAPVSEEDLKKAYEDRKETLLSEEERSVKFVALTLDEKAKSLQGKEKRDALQGLADKADSLVVALEDSAAFEDTAKKLELPVTTTGLFTRGKLDPALEKVPNVSSVVFQLTAEKPNSDPVQTENGFYIFHLNKTVTSKPLTFDEAKDKLAKQLQEESTSENLNVKSGEIRQKIEEELKAGKSFEDSAKAAGQTAEKLPPFSLAEPKLDIPNGREIVGQLSALNEKELSQFVPTDNGGLLVYLEKRQPVDQAEFDKQKDMLKQNLVRFRMEVAFREWLKTRRADANIDTKIPQA